MPPPLPSIFPRPREILAREGRLAVPPGRAGREWLDRLPRTAAGAREALAAPGAGYWRIEPDPGLPAEGYRLTLEEGGVRLCAADARGLLHGARVARELF